MNKVFIPFCPFQGKQLNSLISLFMGLGVRLTKMFPYLKIDLRQAELPFNDKEYCSILALQFFFYFIVGALILGILAFKLFPENIFPLALTGGAVLGLGVVVQTSMYPKMVVKKKVRDLERNLVFALRTMLIQVKSGVPLFDSMKTVASGSFGELSKAFSEAVDEISTGVPEETALQKLATNNPSGFLRKTLWQLVNGMKSGTDVSIVLTSLVDNLTKEQKISIQRYGSALKLLSLMYMMIGVIIPALGITFLIILSSFPQINIGEFLFWLLLVLVFIMQFMYIGIIKSKRPNILGDN
ncbi:MAG: type II secretion system F family protein [archaeon]